MIQDILDEVMFIEGKVKGLQGCQEVNQFQQSSQFYKAEMFLFCGVELFIEGDKEESLEEGDINQHGVDIGFDPCCGGIGHLNDVEMAFPGFEDDFNAPADFIDLGDLLSRPGLPVNIGNKDIEAHKIQMIFAGI